MIPPDWLPEAAMDRVIVHWTAGRHKASADDLAHYHLLMEGGGRLLRGVPAIDRNEAPLQEGYAAHTLNCNSGSIGFALCGMSGAVEQPFDAGRWPITAVQWERLAEAVAQLCRRYQIPVGPRTVLSHAEMQGTLGIQQRGKWDIARLPFDASLVGAEACGDDLRARVASLLPGRPSASSPLGDLPGRAPRSSPLGDLPGRAPRSSPLVHPHPAARARPTSPIEGEVGERGEAAPPSGVSAGAAEEIAADPNNRDRD